MPGTGAGGILRYPAGSMGSFGRGEWREFYLGVEIMRFSVIYMKILGNFQ